MRFYSIGYGELLRLPITVFWELSRNIDRIRAEEDMRMFAVVANVLGGEVESFLNKLEAERGEITSSSDPDTGFDRTGFDRLKYLISKGKKQ